MAPALRLLFFFLSGGAALGFRVIESLDVNCSQPGIQCTVKSSDCLDLSWMKPFQWTPTAPSYLEVTAGIGLNEQGHHVPVLLISWNVGIDSSIKDLQGADISVMEFSTSRTRCVQFQFGSPFLSQRDQNNQPWRFFYNQFEVEPGDTYHISVQHLPKEKNLNRREQDFTVPRCIEEEMTRTNTCCKRGHCWNHNIAFEFIEGKLMVVTFTPQREAYKYGVEVRINNMESTPPIYKYIDLPQGASSQRLQVNFTYPKLYEDCWYNVTVWPQMPSCGTDCVRQWFSPKCPTTPPPPPPDLSRLVKVWPIAAAVMIMASVIILLLLCFQRCIIQADPKIPIVPLPDPPSPVRQKVWLVYSADHKRYVNAVIRLADFLRVSWGMDVVLDRYQSHDIGIKGAMTWLGHQKEQIEQTKGAVLILCSKGTQAKWRAMKDGQDTRVTLREDSSYLYGDLFTPALALILPDFQRASPYDRYVVAYFSELCHDGDIPSPLEMCPRYALVENLHNLLFRIQRIERHQPNVQYNVNIEGPTYQHLLKAIEQCRTWQETHSDWFERQCSPVGAEEEDESVEEQIGQDEDGHEVTRRNYPQIRIPENSVSTVSPIIMEPDPIRSLNPSLVEGPSSVCMVPMLNVEHSPVTILQPSLNTEASGASYRQQPFLAHVDESLPVYNDRLHQMDLSTASDQGFQSEDLREAQIRLYAQSFLEDQHISPHMIFHTAGSSLGSEDPRAAALLGLEESLLTVNDPLPSDRGIQSMESQSVLENSPGATNFNDDESFYGSEGCLGDEEASTREHLLPKDLSILCDQEDPTMDLVKAQMKLFFQNVDLQDLTPDMFLDADMVYEHQPLMVDADRPVPSVGEPLPQIEPSIYNGQGSQSVVPRHIQKHRLLPYVLEGHRVTPEMAVLGDEIDVYERMNVPNIPVNGRKDNVQYQSADLGYGTMKQDKL